MKNNNVNTFTRTCLASVFALALVACGGGSSVETSTNLDAVNPTQPVSDWELVWSDEFEGDAIDTNNWTHEINCIGGGNNEKQCYTDSSDNSFVSDGALNIVALPAAEGAAQPYTSARLNTRYKADFKYGRIEMRAQLPSGQGSWPAFWMLPTDYVYGGWPRSGEIDIMEAVNLKATDPRDGLDQRSIYGTLHYGQAFPNNDQSGVEFKFPEGTNPADDFHTYAIEWEEGEIRWYVDDFLYATQRRTELTEPAPETGNQFITHRGWYTEYIDRNTGQLEIFWTDAPFDQDFHLILNLAVGGNWPENVNELGIDADAFQNGQSFVIDYVRVYECAADPITGKGCATIRSGYDQLIEGDATINGFESNAFALREGEAPNPPLTGAGGESIEIFSDALGDSWQINACCDGNSSAEVITEDDGNVYVQFTTTGDAAVTGFDSRLPSGGASFDISSLAGSGFLKFDVRVIQQPSSGAGWLVKVEQNGECCSNFAEIPLADLPEGAPVVGEWISYSIPVADLISAGLSPTQVDAFFVFPGFTTGNGAIVQLDNVRFEGAADVDPIAVFDGEAVAPWALNIFDAPNATFEIVEDEGENVAQFSIVAPNAVVGFETRSASEQVDITNFIGVGALEFDLKVVQQPTSGQPWLLKVEQNGECCSGFAEFQLANLPEGAPVVGEWKRYSIPVSNLVSAGLTNTPQVDAIFVFPGFTTGEGAVVQMKNVGFVTGNAGGGDDGGDNGGDDGGDGGGGDDGGDTPSAPVYAIGQEIISNGTFDTDAEGWTGGMMMADGERNVLFNEVSAAGDPWSVNSSQILALEPATNYILSFTARASQARDIIAGIGLNAAPFSADVETVALTTEYQTFTLNLSTLDENGDAFSDPEARVLFDLGAQVGDVFLDDISLVKAPQLVVNNGFDFGEKHWIGAIGEENIVNQEDNNVYFVDVTSAGDAFAVNLSQVMTLEPSRTYTVSFRARSNVDRTMLAGLGLNAAPWHANSEEVSLSSEWQAYTLTIETISDGESIPFGDENSRVLFDMGAQVGEVYIDDVSVELIPADAPELVINGSFENVDSWTGAIGPDNIIDDDGNSVYFVDVTSAGDPWAVNLSQVMTLSPSTSYTVSFRAKATVARSMLAGLGLNAAPFYAATETVELTTDWQTFNYTITTISTGESIPFGDENSRILFDMGAEVGGVYIDDVSVKQQQ
nr:carbohydrate binding domain-containing protein [Ningiella ruwaisensis]